MSGFFAFWDTEYTVLIQTTVGITGIPIPYLYLVSVAVSSCVVVLLDECLYEGPKAHLRESILSKNNNTRNAV